MALHNIFLRWKQYAHLVNTTICTLSEQNNMYTYWTKQYAHLVNKTICTLSEQNTLMYIKCIPLNGKLLKTHYWMNSLFESVNMYTYRIMHVTRRITVIDVCMYKRIILDILNLLLLLNISSLCVWNVAHNHVKQFCILTFTTYGLFS